MADTSQIDPDLGFEINGSGRQYFDNVITDNLMDALMELSATVWTIRDRQIVLEKVLSDKGIDADSLIEAHTPSETELAERAAERDEMVKRVFGAFLRRPDNGVAKDADVPSLREITD